MRWYQDIRSWWHRWCPPGAGRSRWPTRHQVRRRVRELWRGRDVAFIYSGILVLVTLILVALPDPVAERFISDSSTNLDNLRLHPPLVLVLSAFVQPAPTQLLIVPVLVWAYGAVQRWLGRAATIVTGFLGHVGATLFVATILTAGIVHGRISLAVAAAADVGPSYGVVAAMGLLVARVPRRFLAGYVGGLSGVLLVILVAGRTFTDLGHAVAWVIGLALALVATRARRAAVATVAAAPRASAAEPLEP